jgi:hypothetical protein
MFRNMSKLKRKMQMKKIQMIYLIKVKNQLNKKKNQSLFLLMKKNKEIEKN